MAQKSLPFLKLPRSVIAVLIGVTILSVLVYLIAAKTTFRLGFPLDDAWIHQTYARNLAYYGEWSFFHGQTSGGSTAPLWSALLAPGFILGLSPLIWTYLLGTIILAGLAVFAELYVRGSVKEYHSKLPWIGIFIVLEWHLVWAALSGMETILSAFLVTIVLGLLALDWRNYMALGLLIGIGVWVRPDAVTLMGPVLLVILISGNSWKERLWDLFRVFMGAGIILAFYFLFNLVVAGAPFPNTFYAKQAEYAILQQTPFPLRFFNIFILPLTGAGIILLPGVVVITIRTFKNKEWGVLAGMVWFVGYITLYALRLPVTYQHGRYIIPAMPIFFIWGLAGMVLISADSMGSRWRWVLIKTWQFSTVIVLLSFWVLGARAYAEDVAVIESEMVETAQWAADNIPVNSVVAAHDIGALGYFAPRRLLDLAGLVSPEIIPIIRDEEQLEKYLNQNRAEYLIIFPDWYSRLDNNLQIVFSSNGKFAPTMGQENMAVFYWTRP